MVKGGSHGASNRGLSGMFELSVKGHFSGAHRLVRYQGPCARVHGHNWDVEVFLRGRRLDAEGLLVDFKRVKEEVRAALDALDHRDLNRLPMFADRNPTSEHLARYLFDTLAARLNSRRCAVHRVWVSETPGTAAAYWKDP